jgi:myo-inositol-1(or 4)-monophosphatase
VTDLELIADAAAEAAELAMRLQRSGLEIAKKDDGTPVTDADLAVDRFLCERLRRARPEYGWLSEESVDDLDRLGKDRLFIVDPIDGTRAFMVRKPYWAVCVAVVAQGEPVAAVVQAGALAESYQASRGDGATLNGAPIQASGASSLAGSRMLADAALFARPEWTEPWPPMHVETRSAIAYRMVLVASGAFDCCLAMSAKSEWDAAAASLIAVEAGARVTDRDGVPLRFNTPQARTPSLVCAAPGLHALILRRTSTIELQG